MRETSAPDANVDGLCPSPADLMCASTAELPPEEQQAVIRHLSHCPHCQAALRESQELVDLIAANAAYLFDKSSTAPASVRTVRFASVTAVRFAAVTGWLSLAATLVVVLALFGGFLRNPDIARADEILQRLAERQGRSTTINPWYVWTVHLPSRGLPSREAIDSRALLNHAEATRIAEALLHDHGFALRDPFSITAIQAWRAGLAQRRDRVTYRDGEIVVTITGRDALSEIEIVIDPEELVIVSQRWMFSGVGRLECRRPTSHDGSPTNTDNTRTPEAGR